jgi:hypothetical protein
MQAFEQLIVSNTVKSLTAGVYHPSRNNKAQKALISVETDAIRFRTDEGTPTTAIGMLGSNGDTIELESYDEISKFRAIRVTNDATLNITYNFGV